MTDIDFTFSLNIRFEFLENEIEIFCGAGYRRAALI